MAWEALAIQGGIAAGLFLINKYIVRDERKRPPAPQKLDIARTEEGTPIPLIYGKVRVDSPVLAWWGNPSRNYVDAAGIWRYGANFLFIVGIPHESGSTDALGLNAVYWGDSKRSTMTGVSVPLLHEGGAFIGSESQQIVGFDVVPGEFNASVVFFDGRSGQSLSSLTGFWDSDITLSLVPGYEHQAVVAIYCPTENGAAGIGADPRLPQVSFEVTGRRDIMPFPLDGINPVRAIYDLITAAVWKLGYTDVDLASFDAAATTLSDEAHDFSGVFYESQPATQIIQQICAQIDAIVYEDPTTSQIKIKLVRADYDLGTVPVLSKADTIGVPEVSGTTQSEAANQVVVTFTDRENDYQQGTARAQKLGAIFAAGNRIKSVTIDYPNVLTRSLAEQLAARELNSISRPLVNLTAMVKRSMATVLPGDVIKVNLPDLNITNRAMRVMDVDYGQLADGAIKLTLMEDVFANNIGGYTVNPLPWPSYFLLPIWDRLALESPYWLNRQLADQSLTSSAENRLMLALAANRYDVSATSFQTQAPSVFVPDAWSNDVPGGDGFRRWADVAVAYPRTAEPYDTGVGLQITAGGSLPTYLTTMVGAADATTFQIQQGQRLCVLYDADGNHEFIAFAAVTGGPSSYTLTKVWRGLLDTAPRDWPVGSRLLYLSTGYVGHVGRRSRPVGDSDVRWQPFGAASGQPVRVTDTLVIAERALLPLPAQSLSVYGDEMDGTVGQGGSGYYREVSSLDGSLNTDARPRSRTLALLTNGTSSDQGVPAGTTWSLYGQRAAAYGFDLEEDEVLITDGLTSPAEVGVMLGKVGHGSIDLKLRTVLDGLTSYTDPTVRIEAAPYRNLLRNGAATEGVLGWTDVGVNPIGTAGTTPRKWFTASTTTGIMGLELASAAQTVDVSGYQPAGLTASLTFQHRCTSTSGAMLYTVDLIPLDAAGATLAGTATTGSITSQLTLFKTVTLEIATLPATTAQIKVVFTTNSTGANLEFTEFRLNVGRVGAQLLTNPTFDT
jgi:hypothetical protein